MSEPMDLTAIKRENDERKARQDAAVPGPWVITLGSGHNLMTAIQSECAEDGHMTPIADCLADWMLERAAPNHVPTMEFLARTRDDPAPKRIDALLALVRQQRAALVDNRSGRPQCRGCYAYLDRKDGHSLLCWAAAALALTTDKETP